MRIGLQAWGSEGDIRPFIALGQGLARRGHDVELVYTDFEDRQFESLAASLGFRARGVAMPVVANLDEMTRIGLRMAQARDPLTQGQIIVKYLFNPVSERISEASTDLCRRSDLVVGHFFVYQLQAAAALAGRAHASMMFAHNLVPTRSMTPTGLPRLGTWANTLEWKLARFALNRAMLPDINRVRTRLGLDPCRDVMTQAWTSHRLNLIAVSPTVCQPASDWPSHHRVTGFLKLTNDQETVTNDVQAFLNEGPPPVFMGFGSLMPRDQGKLDETVALLRDAAARARSRAVIHVPPGSHVPVGRDGDVLVIGRVSHAALFPRCAMAVHHGGAGTTQTALSAGIPSIVVPHVADQFFWADELMRIGVALTPIRRRSLTAEALADRIRATLANEGLRRRAQALAPRIRVENGVENAADLIENLGEQ